MSSALTIGSRALTTNLAALQVIGHNIANVNTEGYSRQSVQLSTAGYQQFGNGFYGKGVEIATVERSYNAYLTREARSTSSVAAADTARLDRLTQLESLFPTGDSGLGTAINDMLNAWGDVSSSPGNLTARVVVLSEAEDFATRLRNTAGQLDLMALNSQQQAEGIVGDINKLAQDLATVNKQLQEAGGSRHTPNDLLDTRDKILAQMSKQVQISTVEADNGMVNVFVAGSQPLVLGLQANRLEVTRDPADTSRIALSFVQGGQSTQVESGLLGGGELSGLMTFINEDLTDVRNQLGRLAVGIATTLNEQHKLGVDLKGNPGQNFFVPPASAQGIAAASNTGTASISASVSDPAALMASDYDVRFDGSNYAIVRLSDGNTQTFSSLTPAPVVDGLTFTLNSGSLAANDSYRLKPFEAAARDLQVALGSPDRLAAASPVQVTPGTGNAGGLSVESLYAISSPATGATVAFQADGTYTINGALPGTPFKPGVPIEANGWSLTLRGTPTAGDTFTVGASSTTGIGQNAGNAKAILDLRERPTFEGVALADGYVGLFSNVGTRVQSAKFASEFSASVAQTAETARSNEAGVNLDEEAARLLQFQQAYQASAKFLQIAQSTFDSLLQTVGR
jgi:flagellar hook-associated protein 1 FlgK